MSTSPNDNAAEDAHATPCRYLQIARAAATGQDWWQCSAIGTSGNSSAVAKREGAWTSITRKVERRRGGNSRGEMQEKKKRTKKGGKGLHGHMVHTPREANQD